MAKKTAAPKQIDPKALREKLKLNQKEFWEPIAVTQSGGSRYESGRPMPRPVQKLYAIRYGSAAQRDATIAALTL